MGGREDLSVSPDIPGLLPPLTVGPGTLPRIQKRSIVSDLTLFDLTNDQWNAVIAEHPVPADFAVRTVDDIASVLSAARGALADRDPGDLLACPALMDINIWEVVEDDEDVFIVVVQVSPHAAWASRPLHIRSVIAHGVRGSDAARTALELLLATRNDLLIETAAVDAAADSLAAYATSIGVQEDALDEIVHETGSAAAAMTNNGGTGTQIAYLTQQYWPRGALDLIRRAAQARLAPVLAAAG
ncbi:hypothetical protein GCM10020219_001480 [Nonomuraea dietziae]